jgi:hypothetical protein
MLLKPFRSHAPLPTTIHAWPASGAAGVRQKNESIMERSRPTSTHGSK